jgi:cytochrome c oxidase subunit II
MDSFAAALTNCAMIPHCTAVNPPHLGQPVRRGDSMTKIGNRFCLPGFAFVLAMALSQGGSLRAQENVQVIEVTAKKYEFSPTPIHVKAGTKVQLKITAIDHDHGFTLSTVPTGAKKGDKPGLTLSSAQECVQLKKGQSTTVEFTAQTPGSYPFHCCHVCGLGHKKMKSEIVVE